MVENLVDDGASVFRRGRPIVGSHFVVIFHELVLVFFLVVVRDLGSATCGESDLGLRWRLAASGNGVLTLALLLGGDVATGANVAIRLRVGASRAIDWCGLV
jgi:hypothetical protein